MYYKIFIYGTAQFYSSDNKYVVFVFIDLEKFKPNNLRFLSRIQLTREMDKETALIGLFCLMLDIKLKCIMGVNVFLIVITC